MCMLAIVLCSYICSKILLCGLALVTLKVYCSTPAVTLEIEAHTAFHKNLGVCVNSIIYICTFLVTCTKTELQKLKSGGLSSLQSDTEMLPWFRVCQIMLPRRIFSRTKLWYFLSLFCEIIKKMFIIQMFVYWKKKMKKKKLVGKGVRRIFNWILGFYLQKMLSHIS